MTLSFKQLTLYFSLLSIGSTTGWLGHHYVEAKKSVIEVKELAQVSTPTSGNLSLIHI